MLVPLSRDKQKALRRDFINNFENTDLEIRVSGLGVETVSLFLCGVGITPCA